MTAPIAHTPTGLRLQLASLLRQLRENAGITQSEAGKSLPHKRPQNKLARLERGDCGLTTADLETLLTRYRVSDPDAITLAHLLNTRAATRATQRGRVDVARSGYGRKARRYVDLEEDAQLIREVCVEHVPELLRCESYLRTSAAHGLADGRSDTVRARQRTVLRSGTQLHVVLSESAVRRIPGGAGVVREQIEHLIGLSRDPGVDLRMVPFSANLTAESWLENFILLRLRCPGTIHEIGLDFAYTHQAGELVSADGRIDDYEALWMNATGAACAPEQTRRILRAITRQP